MSKAYDEAVIATKEMRKALRIGDIIAAYFKDTEERVLYLVLSNSKITHHDIEVIDLSRMGKRTTKSTLLELNTDKWMKIGMMQPVTPVALDYVQLGRDAYAVHGPKSVPLSHFEKLDHIDPSKESYKNFCKGFYEEAARIAADQPK